MSRNMHMGSQAEYFCSTCDAHFHDCWELVVHIYQAHDIRIPAKRRVTTEEGF